MYNVRMTQKKFTLNEEQLKELEWTMSHDRRVEVVQRATAIRLLHYGHKPDQLADMFVVDATTIYNWHKRWRQAGIEGLANQPRTGRPPKANAEYCQHLAEALSCEPSDYGYEFALWTVGRLRQHLYEQTQIDLSEDRLRVLLADQGYVYRRPKQDLSALQDQAARQDALQVLDELKKEPVLVLLNSSLWTKQR
jgi:transposase